MSTRGGGERRAAGPRNELGERGTGIRPPLPRDAVAAWNVARARPGLNAGLVFDRYVAPGSRGEGRRETWADVVQAGDRADRDLAREALARWRVTVAGAGGQVFTMSTDWRLVAGLGRGGPLEVGFAFDRYGFPVLPGSGLKGLARAWGLRQVAREAGVPKLLGKLDEALGAPTDFEKAWREELGEAVVPASAHDFRAIFGTTGGAGGAIYFDGVPTATPDLKLDIMNPHYPRYYRGEGPPSDDQNPVPVYFLTVAPDSEFAFAVGWRAAAKANGEGPRLRRLAEDWLRQGLVHLGAGAKTSAGYGYFVGEGG